MSGFVWRYAQEPGDAPGRYRLMISTTRRCYGQGERAWWDEEITGTYARDNVPLRIFRGMQGERLEKVVMVAEVGEGDLIQLHKDGVVSKYVLFHDETFHLLDGDFAPVVKRYLEQSLSPAWLLAQEGQGQAD